ncbi:hypothetical protein Q3G72_003448 [Acer saccharum]|nr:hypothetical protein Q3G72_003448 [Acer saccharum]
MQIDQEIDAIEIVSNHEIMAQEQASNLSEIILEEETHDDHSEGLAATTVEPSFQIPTIQIDQNYEVLGDRDDTLYQEIQQVLDGINTSRNRR